MAPWHSLSFALPWFFFVPLPLFPEYHTLLLLLHFYPHSISRFLSQCFLTGHSWPPLPNPIPFICYPWFPSRYLSAFLSPCFWILLFLPGRGSWTSLFLMNPCRISNPHSDFLKWLWQGFKRALGCTKTRSIKTSDGKIRTFYLLILWFVSASHRCSQSIPRFKSRMWVWVFNFSQDTFILIW